MMKNLKISQKLLMIFIGFVVISGLAITILFQTHFKSEINKFAHEQANLKLEEATSIAYSIIKRNYDNYIDGVYTEEKAKQNSLQEIKYLRYGAGDYGYFWINDYESNMVMESMASSLDGQNMKKMMFDSKGEIILAKDKTTTNTGIDVKTKGGNDLFPQFVKVAKTEKEGVIVGGIVNYTWPRPGQVNWIDKVSYVRAFHEWGWIVGTGMSVEDLSGGQDSISSKLMKSIFVVFGIILAGLIGVILFVMIPVNKSFKEIVESVNNYTNFDFKEKIDIEQNDEIGELSDSINKMVDAVKIFLIDIRVSVNDLGYKSIGLLEAQKEQDDLDIGGGENNFKVAIRKLEKNIWVIAKATKQVNAKFYKIDQPFKKLSESANKISKFMSDVGKAMNAGEGEEVEVDIESIEDTFEELKFFKEELVRVQKSVEKAKKDMGKLNKSVDQASNNANSIIKDALKVGGVDIDRSTIDSVKEVDIDHSTIDAVREVSSSVDKLIKMTKGFNV